MPDITSVGGATSAEFPDLEPAAQQAQQLIQNHSTAGVVNVHSLAQASASGTSELRDAVASQLHERDRVQYMQAVQGAKPPLILHNAPDKEGQLKLDGEDVHPIRLPGTGVSPPIVNQSLLNYLAQQREQDPVSASQYGATSVPKPKAATRNSSSQGSPGPSSSSIPSNNTVDARASADGSRRQEMPGVFTSLAQGVFAGVQDIKDAGTMVGGRPDDVGPASPAAAPLQWSDLLSPKSVLAPKVAYQIGQSFPTTAGGIAGASVGVALAGGPEDPISVITGAAGGFIGAGMVGGLQSFGNYFRDELHKTPDDPNGAYSRALGRATISGAFSGAAWAAFPARTFEGPLKNMMFQAFGLQPAISMAHRATDNAVTGQPVTEGLGNAYTQGSISTLATAAGHEVANRVTGGIATTKPPPEHAENTTRPPPADRLNITEPPKDDANGATKPAQLGRIEAKELDRYHRAKNTAESYPGHGHGRHGAQTTMDEQTRRVQTGYTADGNQSRVSKATKFSSHEKEVEAVERARAKNPGAGKSPFDPKGRPNRDTIVVPDGPEGYGSGTEVQKGTDNRPLPGRPVQSTGPQPNAMIVFEYNPRNGHWDPITQYPSDEPMTP